MAHLIPPYKNMDRTTEELKRLNEMVEASRQEILQLLYKRRATLVAEESEISEIKDMVRYKGIMWWVMNWIEKCIVKERMKTQEDIDDLSSGG